MLCYLYFHLTNAALNLGGPLLAYICYWSYGAYKCTLMSARKQLSREYYIKILAILYYTAYVSSYVLMAA